MAKTRTNKKSVLDLGYGPLNTDYDHKNPKGVWEKVASGKASEIYLEGKGSVFERTRTPAEIAKRADESRRKGTAVMANPKPKIRTTKSTAGSTSVNRKATGAEQRAFEKAYGTATTKKPVAKKTTVKAPAKRTTTRK